MCFISCKIDIEFCETAASGGFEGKLNFFLNSGTPITS